MIDPLISRTTELGLGASRSDPPLSWWLVPRGGGIAAVAFAATLAVIARELQFHDWLTLALALISGALLFAGASQLARNGAAVASWSRRR